MSFDQDKRRRTYGLRFDDDYPGLVVQCRKPGYRALRELTSAVLVLGDDLTGQGLSGATVLEAWDDLFSALERSVVQWNLTDSGQAVPLSQLLDQDWEFLLTVAKAWYREVVQRPPEKRPQPRPQAGGNLDEEPESGEAPLPPTIGEDGTDEEWLAQFKTVPPPPPPAFVPDPDGDDSLPNLDEDAPATLADEPAGV